MAEVPRKSDVLTEKFVKTLHRKMFGKVWTWAGSFRKSGKNIGVKWRQISTQLHTLLQDARYWIEHKTYPEDEIAARFHHKLVWIHCLGRYPALEAGITSSGMKPCLDTPRLDAGSIEGFICSPTVTAATRG
jgi:hypothetical protein